MRPPALVGAVVVAAVLAVVAPASAEPTFEAEPKLEEARERRAAIEERLATETGDLEGLEETVLAAEEEVAGLQEQEQQLRSELDAVEARLVARTRLAFMHGDVTSVQLLLSGQDVTDVTDRAVLLESLSLRDRAAAEEATALRVALEANRQLREERLASLTQLRTELQQQVDQLMADLEQVARDEARFEEELRREREEARRRREAELRRQREEEDRRRQEEAAAAAAADSAPAAEEPADSPQDDAPAPSSGGYACPVGDPVVFADTWGASRSGGRSHQGVDMMSPHGTPIYAITAGKITRMSNSSLGGITLYMFGDDGNEYYYAHLQGYASGTSVGARVSAGTLIAYNGSSGNASASAPHLHLEVHPGGGAAVNPYPYAAMACGR